MKLVRQLPASGTCGQCSVATLASISLADSIAVFGHGRRGGTSTWEVVRALRQLGFVVDPALRLVDDPRPSHFRGVVGRHLLPNTAVVYVRFSDGELHWVVWRNGIWYCPTEGRNPKWTDSRLQVRGYVGIYEPLPSAARIRAGVEVMETAS